MAKALTKILCFILLITAFISCRKEQFTTSPDDALILRQDTLWFDTVFTNANERWPKSVNKQIIIVNPHKEKIRTDIELMGGPQSHFRMNVDGVAGTVFKDIELFPEDSLFIFIEVHPDKNNNSPDFNPLIIRDSVLFYTNGNEQKVNLIGWGQDAHYIFRDSIETDTTWSNTNLPIVIYGYCYVKPDVTLTIESGMQIHYAPGSWMFVEGTLQVNGTAEDPVVMQGDRLQPDWEETAGQWGGIWLSHPTKGNEITHALVKNGTVGIYCDSVSGDNNNTPNVTLDKCFIRNMSYDGIAGKGSYIKAYNTVSANCGRFTFLASFGGLYEIKHCTFHTGSKDFSRRDPTFAVLNINRNEFGQILSEHALTFSMVNSIIDGSYNDGELGLDVNQQANIVIEYSLLKTDNVAFDVNNNILNENPLFIDPNAYNYDLDTLSPAIDAGRLVAPSISTDILDRPRDLNPDMGAFEFQN